MTKTLVERAAKLQMKIGGRRKYVEKEHQELAVAWLNDEVTFTQIGMVLEMKGHSIYGFLATALKAARQSKLL